MASVPKRKSAAMLRRACLASFIAAVLATPALAQDSTGDEQEKESTSKDEPVELERVTATGTHIRNIEQKFAPVVTMTREELDLAGFASPADYLQQMPQNFAGGGYSTPDRSYMSTSGAGFSSVNLRGLGYEASLVLLNGRRVAPSGTAGAAIDTSMIPSGALQRVDVLTDGASAIYGADAIAGVVNFILRRDYIGNETRVRLGSKTGDATDYKLSHTWGTAGERGRLLVSYEYSDEQALGKEDRPYTRDLQANNDILPATRKHGLLVSGGLDLPAGAELFTDLYYGTRDSRAETLYGDHRINKVSSKSMNGTVGVDLPFGRDWLAELSTSVSVTDFMNNGHAVVVRPEFSRMGMWNDEYVWSLDAKADGPLFELPGGTARGVFGAQYRRESHDGAMDFYDATGQALNQRQMEADVQRSVQSVFAEVYAPLAKSFELSLAARYDDYSDFGSSFNPKLGLAWTPLDGVTFRGSYGTSFKAPRLQMLVDKISYVDIVDFVDPEAPGGMSVAAFLYGDRSDLDAEESTSKSFGIDLNPSWAPQLNARLNYYDVEYDGRIAGPSMEMDYDTYLVYGWPLPIDRSVTLEQLNAWIAEATFGLSFNYTTQPGGSNSTLEDVTVLFDGRPTNTATSRQRGIDADIDYRWTLPGSTLTASLDGNYILEAEDQFSPVMDPVRQYGRIFLQARFKGRAGLNWANKALSLNLGANYVGSNKDDRFVDRDVRVGSWLTWDASLQYRFGEGRGPAWLDGTRLTFSVQNLLDEAPPRIVPSMQVGGGAEYSYVAYDSANADPYGRWMSIQFTKEW